MKKQLTAVCETCDEQNGLFVVNSREAGAEKGGIISFDPTLRMQKNPLIFKPLKVTDRVWVAPLLSKEQGIAADQCFGTLYLWGGAYDLTAAEYEGRLLLTYGGGKELSFGYPAGSGALAPAIDLMSRKAKEEGVDLLIRGLSGAQREALEQEFPGRFTFKECRDSAEYLYEAQTLATLTGRKLHSKRNHCSRFEQEYPNWHAETLRPEHFADCRALLEAWEQRHSGEVSEIQIAEQIALERTFANYETLGMDGIILYAGDRPAAFSVGERVGKDCVDVHFEKADTEINGAYPVVNREFVRMMIEKYPTLRYVNREEDMGLESLRKAKESYRPAFMLNKYVARERENQNN